MKTTGEAVSGLSPLLNRPEGWLAKTAAASAQFLTTAKPRFLKCFLPCCNVNAMLARLASEWLWQYKARFSDAAFMAFPVRAEIGTKCQSSLESDGEHSGACSR